MTAPSFRLEVAHATDVGAVRKVNEDSFHIATDTGLWCVADGMGGLENGRWASTTVVEALNAAGLTGDFDADVGHAADAIHAANATVWEAVSKSGRAMGSTVVALLIRDRRFAVLWAGDSRAYLLRAGTLHRLSRDHSQVQEMVDRGYLSPEEAKGHPMSHVISRAVGVEAALELDVITDEAEPRDVFLLASDGLTGPISDPEIADCLARLKPEAACESLVRLSLSRGAPDNVTVVIVACAETTDLAPAEASDG